MRLRIRSRLRTRFPGFQDDPPSPRQRLFGHARTRTTVALWAGATSLLLATAAIDARTRQLQAEHLHLAAAQAPVTAPPPTDPLSAAQETRWRQAIDQLNADWAAWFDALERHTPPQVVLRAIEPDAAQRRLQVQGEAASLEELMDWARALDAEGRFASVRPRRHDTSESASGLPVRLTLDIALTGGDAAATAGAPAERETP